MNGTADEILNDGFGYIDKQKFFEWWKADLN